MLRKIWEKYYGQCNGIVFVVDGANESRLEEVSMTLDKIYDDTELVDLPVLILVNKADSPDFLGQDSVREHLQLS